MSEKIPKDLGIKVGSKEQVMWENIKEGSEKAIMQGKADIEIHGGIVKLAEAKIAEEEAKFNSA